MPTAKFQRNQGETERAYYARVRSAVRGSELSDAEQRNASAALEDYRLGLLGPDGLEKALTNFDA